MSDTARVIATFWKHPTAVIDIDFRLVSDDGDTITQVESREISPSGALASNSASINGATAKVWFTGGEDEVDYEVQVPIVTALNRKEIGLCIVKVRA